jgi:hypothetical protein
MNEESSNTLKNEDVPASLRRRKKEPQKAVQVRIALSQWEELSAFARDYDQDVSTFIREAIEDWLRRARKVHQTDTSRDRCDC